MGRVWRFDDDVNTDQIVPGRFAPYMTSEDELRKFPFIEARPEFAEQVQPGDVIVAGMNFGCGSSREYAARALELTGLGAVISPLFARIFARNAMNLGLACFETSAADHLADGDTVEIDLDTSTLTTEDGVITLPAPPSWVRDVWREGGLIAYLQRHGTFPGEVPA